MIPAPDYPYSVILTVARFAENMKRVISAIGSKLNSTDISDWIEENVCGTFSITHDGLWGLMFRFEREDDAILFLLRFGGRLLEPVER